MLKPQYIPNHQDHCISTQQVQHLYECLSRDTPFNPAQADQFVQMEEPHLPDFLYHMDEDEDPVPYFAMTNPYEAILPRYPARICVQITPGMLQSFQPLADTTLEADPGIDIWYPQDSGKTHFCEIGLWSIMSDRPSYSVHPQPSGVTG